MAGELTRRSLRSLLVAGSIVGGLVGALTGCAGEVEALDPSSVEEQVASALADPLEPAVEVVTCPAELPIDEAFSCRAALDGVEGELMVEVAYDEVDGLSVEPSQAVLGGTEIADALRDALDDQFGRTFQVDCGDDGLRVIEPGTTVVCRANDGGSRRSVDVTVEDAAGSLAFEVIDP